MTISSTINDLNAVSIFCDGKFQYCRIYNTKKIAEINAIILVEGCAIDLEIARKIEILNTL